MSVPFPPHRASVNSRAATAGLILQQHMNGMQGMAFARWVCAHHPAAITRRGSLWRCELLGLTATSPSSAERAILLWCDAAQSKGGTP